MRNKSSGKSLQMAILSGWPSRTFASATYILRKLPLTYLIAVKIKMDSFLMCQEMFHASFSTEALINDYKCLHARNSDFRAVYNQMPNRTLYTCRNRALQKKGSHEYLSSIITLAGCTECYSLL